jgi:3-oxoacyl-[acyl-carrier protein] reductase
MMTQLYAERLAGDDIMCYEVRPGIIETDMTRPARARYEQLIAEGITPVKRWGRPEDVGRTVAALASRALPFNTGAAFFVDGGLHMKVL